VPNPFITISPGYRFALLGYLFLYEILTPGLIEILHGPTLPWAGWLFAADLAYEVLIFLPILLYHPTYGWLHPLIFASLFSTAKSLVKDPQLLLAPFMVFTKPWPQELFHVALQGWSLEAIAWTMLEASLISIIAIIAYYGGFFCGPRLSVPRLSFGNPRYVAIKAVTIAFISTAAFMGYMQLEGGVSAHMLSWAAGRFEARGSEGPIHLLIQTGMVATLVWFGLERTASRNPLFWASAIFSMSMNFFVTGSRSSILYSIVLLLMIWMIRAQKIPKILLPICGAAALLIFGSLGVIRGSVYQQEVDWSVIAALDLERSLERASAELKGREAVSGYLPIVAKVPDEVGLLDTFNIY
jgi:hypothetical protein